MTSEREIQEMIARCVSLMVYYWKVGRSRKEHARMIAEAQEIARWARKSDLWKARLVEEFLQPLEAELIVRFGRVVGSRLNSAFVRAFESSGKQDRSPSVGTEVRIGVMPVTL